MSEEIVTWAVVKHGCIDYICRTEELAKKQNEVSGGTVVKLTGEMPRPLMKMATFVYEDRVYTVRVTSFLVTEKQAKEWCDENHFKLIKWPYGEILELSE